MEKVRCINLDWLEVFCLEPLHCPHDADYYERQGYQVKRRLYGTPQYREMFTLIVDGVEFVEVRRAPYSVKKDGGIFDERATHLRLSNRTCYEDAPIDHLRAFMVAHSYEFTSITRIDIAWDFCRFDNGDEPSEFMRRYMHDEISKVYQSRVSAHGVDTWNERLWNSVKWGSPSSAITTKLYNKTLELKQSGDKPYIRDVWRMAGLDTGQDVWRIEFSLSSQMQTVKARHEGIVQKHSLCTYDSPSRLWRQFLICFNRYFDFRLKEYTEHGGIRRLKRKYECTRLELLDAHNSTPYVLIRNPTKVKRADRILKILCKRLQARANEKDCERPEHDAIMLVLSSFNYRYALGLNIKRRDFDTEFELTSEVYQRRQKELDEGHTERMERLIMNNLLRKYGYLPKDDTMPF